MMNLSLFRDNLAKNGYLHIQSCPNDWINFIQEITLSTIMPQDEGELIYDVKSTPGYEKFSNGKSQNFLRPHTEASYRDSPPQYIVLRCLQPANCGGGHTSFVDGYSFLLNLTEEVKNKLMNDRYKFMSNQGTYKIYAPILKFSQSKPPILRFNYNALIYGEHSPYILKKEYEQESFLSYICQEVKHFFCDNKISIRLEKKELLIIDNYRMFHARSSFLDPNRHLQNVWIS